MMVVVLAQCFIFSITVCSLLADTATDIKFYSYDWPHLINRYANFTDRNHHAHGVEFPQWTSNFGAGRPIDPAVMEYKTSQFSLFKIMYERTIIDNRRTPDPTKAKSFFIPYDFGMDATFFETNGRMRKTSCPLASEASRLLRESPYFSKNYGHDHTLVVSVNQNMNYFFSAAPCVEFLQLCWNCTKLVIDEYMFIAKDRNFELKNRGINWHAVPFPSDYHFDDREIEGKDGKHVRTPAWEWTTENRSLVVSYLGNPRKFSPVSTLIREALVTQCHRHNGSCSHGVYKHDATHHTISAAQHLLMTPSHTPHISSNTHHANTAQSLHYESLHAVFCLQPPGDMPSRKSVFDVILSGCIPVFFHPLTARLMYEWHWTRAQWEEIGVHFDSYEDNHELIQDKTDFIQKLVAYSINNKEEVAAKRQKIREFAFRLQYSLMYVPEEGAAASAGAGRGTAAAAVPVVSRRKSPVTGQTEEDAYDVSMSHVLRIHAGMASHQRSSGYASCMQTQGSGKQMLQTAEWCNVTVPAFGADPYSPPATVSVLFSKRT